MITSTRLTKQVISAAVVVSYVGNSSKASSLLPEAPEGWAWSPNQFRSFRWNLTVSTAAKPNSQGSYHFGHINITHTIKLANSDGRTKSKLRCTIDGVSHMHPEPLSSSRSTVRFQRKAFKYNVISDASVATVEKNKVSVEPNVVNVTYHTFVEIIW